VKAVAALALGITIITNGHAVTLPDIGNAEYSRSCQITRNWDDDVLARCREDGAVFRFDGDGQPSIAHTPHRFPKRSGGWVAVN
jgi:hypothetical protein